MDARIVFSQTDATPTTYTDSPGTSVIGVSGFVVHLSNGDNAGAHSWEWTLTDVPHGSALTAGTVLASGTSASTASFTPDVPGCFRITLVIQDLGGTTITQNRNFAVPFSNGWIIPSFKATAAELNFGGNTRGWAKYLEQIIDDLDAFVATGGLNSPALAGKLPFSTGVAGIVNWRFATADDVLPGFSVTFTGGANVEIGVTYAPSCHWTASSTPTSVTFSDDAGSTPVSELGSPTFTGPSYHKVTMTTVTMTLTIVGVTTKTPTQAVNFWPKVFWGSSTQGVRTQADAEALANSAITNTRARTLGPITVGTGEVLKYYCDKLLGTPTFLFGAIPTGFVLTTVSFTRNGVTRDYWCCEAPTSGTGVTTVTAQ